jgi:hypothetical protein
MPRVKQRDYRDPAEGECPKHDAYICALYGSWDGYRRNQEWHRKRAEREAAKEAERQRQKAEAEERRRQSVGFAYIIQAGDDGPIKIGTAKNVAKRLAALQTASPVPLFVVGALPGGMLKERELQRKVDRHRIQGEWFAAAALGELAAELVAVPLLRRGAA